MGSPRDQRHYEPGSLEALQAEFPAWHMWKGVPGTGWYAWLPRTSPAKVFGPAADLAELRNWLIGWKWAHDG